MRVIIGAADQSVAAELRTLMGRIEDVQVTSIADKTTELSAITGRERPDIVLLHERLGPQGTKEIVRELKFRSVATSVIVVDFTGDSELRVDLMEAGAKAVVPSPITFDELTHKIEDARAFADLMRASQVGVPAEPGSEGGRNGRVTMVAGSKGGVGATTVATHLAYDLVHKIPDARVCLVDLDLQAGDVSALLEARQNVTIADLAKVSQDLDAGTISDALVLHESGIALLLAPSVIQDTGLVDATAVRTILGHLRQQYDVVVIDGGALPTPAQAAAVEVADEVVVVVTPDVLSMRAYKRLVQAWDSLGVRTEQDLWVLVNRAARDDVLDHAAIGKMINARLVSTQLPSALRRLEKGVNARNPGEVREVAWWRAIEQIGAEVGVHGLAARQAPAPGRRSRSRKPERGRRAVPAKSEAGQVALENVALVPVVVLIALLAWQLALSGLAFVWNGHAANAAVRAASMGEDPREAAREAMPDSMRDKVSVSVLSDGRVRVSTRIPVLCPGCASLPGSITQTASTVEEP